MAKETPAMGMVPSRTWSQTHGGLTVNRPHLCERAQSPQENRERPRLAAEMVGQDKQDERQFPEMGPAYVCGLLVGGTHSLGFFRCLAAASGPAGPSHGCLFSSPLDGGLAGRFRKELCAEWPESVQTTRSGDTALSEPHTGASL